MTQTPTPLPPGLDPNYVFGELMPLIATVTIIVAGGLALRWIFKSPVGEALAQRIRAKAGGGRTEGTERSRELEERVTLLQEQVGELSERVDFAERLLTEQRQRQVRPGGE